MRAPRITSRRPVAAFVGVASLVAGVVGVAGSLSTSPTRPPLDHISSLLMTAGQTDNLPTSRYTPMAPVRVLDSRIDFGHLGAVEADESFPLNLAGRYVPAGTTAVVLNLTATQTGGDGFVSLWPSGAVRPDVSSLNTERANQTIANLVTVPLGADGSVSVYSSTHLDLVADLQGYFAPTAAATSGRLTAIAPQRLLDTRQPGPLSGTMAAGETRSLDISTLADLPIDAVGAVLNVTVTDATAAGYWTVFPSGVERPTASNVNVAAARQTIANSVVVGLGKGVASIYSQTGGQVIVDVTGWFTGPSSGSGTAGLYVAMSPSRVLDSRNPALSSTGGHRLRGGESAVVSLGRNGIPASGVAALVLNATVTETAGAGFFTVAPAGEALPATSTLNAERASQTIANQTIAKVSSAGFQFYSQNGGHVIADVSGYFTAPSTSVGNPTTGSTPTTTGPPATSPPTTTAPSTTTTTAPGSTTTTTAPPTGPPTRGSHAFLYTDGTTAEYARWNPCVAINYTVNYSGAPAFARSAVADTIVRLENATGLNFVDTGDSVGTVGYDKVVPRGDAVVISFPTSAESGGAFDANTLGVGGGSYYAPPNPEVASGYVLVNRDQPFTNGYGDMGLSQTLLHELGHVTGLAHVSDPVEVMYPVSHAVTGYGPGDREGLWYLGSAQGCIPTA